MLKKRYKAKIPFKLRHKQETMQIINSMLIKLRYYNEKMQIFSRKGNKPNEKLYKENLGKFLDLKRELKKFDVEIIKI